MTATQERMDERWFRADLLEAPRRLPAIIRDAVDGQPASEEVRHA